MSALTLKISVAMKINTQNKIQSNYITSRGYKAGMMNMKTLEAVFLKIYF